MSAATALVSSSRFELERHRFENSTHPKCTCTGFCYRWLVLLLMSVISRVQATPPRFVRPSVRPLVGRSVRHINFFIFKSFKVFKSMLSHFKSICKSRMRLIGVGLVTIPTVADFISPAFFTLLKSLTGSGTRTSLRSPPFPAGEKCNYTRSESRDGIECRTRVEGWGRV